MSNVLFNWNSHLDVSESLNQFLQTESFVDVTIAVEGQQLKAHKLILSVYSPYLKSILQCNPSQHPVIFMKDVKFVEMQVILDFIYKGKACVSQENIQGVLRTAEALQITGLSSIIWTETDVDYMEVNPSLPNTTIEGSVTELTHITDDEHLFSPNFTSETKKSYKGTKLRGEGSSAIDASELQSEKMLTTTPEKDDSVTSSELDNERTIPTIERDAKISEDYKEAGKVTRIISEDGGTMMVMEAPSSISITHAPVDCLQIKPNGRQYTKDDLQHALELVRKGEMGIKPAARAFKIPVTTLHHAARKSKISSPMQQGGNRIMRHKYKSDNLNTMAITDWTSKTIENFVKTDWVVKSSEKTDWIPKVLESCTTAEEEDSG